MHATRSRSRRTVFTGAIFAVAMAGLTSSVHGACPQQPCECLGAAKTFTALGSTKLGSRPGLNAPYGYTYHIGTDIFGHRPDPNRLVIEWLQMNSNPSDEILVNYEDLPMMYYLPNPIRGGVVAFRAEDDRVTPPAFAVIRRTVPFVYQSVFAREVARYYWAQVPVQAPDIRWGNNPDPEGHLQDRALTPKLLFFQRVDSTAAP